MGSMTLRRLAFVVAAMTCVIVGASPVVARAAEPAEPLVVEGATAGGLATTTVVQALRLPIRLVSYSAQDIKDVSIDVSPLREPATGNLVAVKLKSEDGKELPASQPLFFPALGSKTITLEADLLASGVYSGSIGLIYNKARHTTAVAITRERPVPSVAVDPVPASTRNSTPVTIRETAGKTAVLDRPALLPLVHALTTAESVGARYEGIGVERWTGSAYQPVSDVLVLEPLGTEQLRVTVRGLSEPGKHEGTLRIANAGEKTGVEAKLTFLLRASPWCAFLLLIVGILLGEWVRRALSDAQGIEEQLAIRDLGDSLGRVRISVAKDAVAVPAVKEALDAVAQAITELATSAAAGGKPSDRAAARQAIADRIKLIPRWVRLCTANSSTDQQILKKLTDVRNFIRSGVGNLAAAEMALDQVEAAAPLPAGGPGGDTGDETPTLPSRRSLSTRLRVIRWSSSALGAATATLLGFLLLYLPNLTWGSDLDKLTMFLWALGVHQITGVAAASTAQSVLRRIEAAGNP